MSWSKFTIIVVVAYVAYYIINIIIDSMRSQGTAAAVANGSDELTFHEDVLATEVEDHVPISIAEERNYPAVAVEEEETSNTIWERQEEDTEELNLLSHNINQSTGGITQMADLIKLPKSDTIDVKRSFVF